MRPIHAAAVLTSLAVAALLAPLPAAAAGHAVVLDDGTRLAARTKPVMAMGEVSFVAADGALTNIDLHRVDVAATRAANGGSKAATSRRVWTARELEQAAGRVQVVGTVESPQPEAPPSDSEQLAMVRARIQQLEDALDGLSADDPEAKTILRMQHQLQGEVQRLLRDANRSRAASRHDGDSAQG